MTPKSLTHLPTAIDDGFESELDDAPSMSVDEFLRSLDDSESGL